MIRMPKINACDFFQKVKGAKKIRRKNRHEEDDNQEIFFLKFRLEFPNEIIFSIPNGGKRHPVIAEKLKKCGVLAGVPDILLARAVGKYHGLFIEMKSADGSVSPKQKKIIPMLLERNYLVEVCYSWEKALLCAQNYLNGLCK